MARLTAEALTNSSFIGQIYF